MIAVADKIPLSFNQFIDWYPEISESRYELKRGVIVQRPKPRGKRSEITGFAIKELNYAIDRMQAPFFIPRECIVKVSDNTGYQAHIPYCQRP